MVKGKSGKAPFPLLKFRVRSGNFRNLIVELVQNADGDVKNFLTHLTIRSDGFRQRDGNNLVPPQRGHLPEFGAVHHVDGAQSVARGQHAVVSGGRSAALDVAEHYRARLEAGPLFDLARHGRADTAQPNMPELIAPRLQGRFTVFLVTIGKLRAFSYHHDAEISSAVAALTNQLRHLVNIERNFGDQYDVGATSDAAVGCDPTGGASHHLDHDHAIVRLGRGMHAVDGFGSYIYSRVEAEGEVGAGQVVVDGL